MEAMGEPVSHGFDEFSNNFNHPISNEIPHTQSVNDITLPIRIRLCRNALLNQPPQRQHGRLQRPPHRTRNDGDILRRQARVFRLELLSQRSTLLHAEI